MGKIHFEKLTPIKDVELKTYKEALDFVFENNEIKNIAITGAYSAGKSSVVESYKRRVPNKKFLHISLANFERHDQLNEIDDDNQEQEENNDTKNYIKESRLEGKILNQLIHQMNPSDIPQTNFKIKNTVPNKSIIKTTTIIIAFIVSGLHLRYHKEWINFVNSLNEFYTLRFMQITTKGISLFLSGAIFSVIFAIAVFNFVRMQKNKSIFKKLNFSGNEIEIFEKSDESYFDKYLNEVLYIFENCNADVIVFEDIDRYNLNEIFQRLREINILVNSKRVRSHKEVLRFFYLVRDDIFISKDRTKFFDFIMPIVPVIDSSNSYNQFIAHLKAGSIFDKFDEHFLQGISLYVDDMRILKNIYNEFVIYYNRIGTTEQDYNKLLAMIVYKNIFPRDFSDTQINIGFVSTIFESRDELIKEEIDKINIKIQELEDKFNDCEKEHINNIGELDLIYGNKNYYGELTVNSNNPQYVERKKNFELIQSNKHYEIKDRISILNDEKVILNYKKLSEVITRENINEIFDVNYKNFIGEINDFNEIKSSQYFDLIKYLIRNGYIDETYTDYMTYFYPNSLSRNDKIFLRSVTDKKAKEWTYNIENPKLVLSRLKEVDFDEIETLNFNLFEYLLQSQHENKKYLDRFMNQLRESRQFKFMQGYFNFTKDLATYIKTTNKYWITFLEEINFSSEFTYKDMKECILQTLYYSDGIDIENINKEGFLSNTISSDRLFLNIEEPNVEKLTEEFIGLNIKFEILEFEESNKGLFESVYNNKLYKINKENIALILKYIFNVENEDDIKNKNYSLLLENPNSKLLEYVNENIQNYIEMIINNCEDKILDTQEAALKLINNNDIDLTKIKEYIMLLDTELTLLKDIENRELWGYVLQNRKIKYSIENILSYYFYMDNTLDETLINFINSDRINFEFSQTYIDQTFGQGSSQKIFESIARCEDIQIENYKKILEELNYIYPAPTQEIQELSEERLEVLVKLDKFEVTSQNIEFLQSNYNKLFIIFIEKSIEKYIDQIEDLPKVKKDELITLLSSNIDDDFKIELISNFEGQISISQIECNDSIKNFIIGNNFDKSDLIYLIANYMNFGNLIKNTIVNICEEHINIIIEDKIDINYDLLIEILKKDNMVNDIKLQLLNNSLDKLSKTETQVAIKCIGLIEYEKIFTNGRPRFEINEVNREFLSKCVNRKWISEFNEEEGVYKISRKGLCLTQ
ncbi:hypothetical protein K0040_02360 [Terrisporobacter petrolearius]|uniref:YobI family P-loop NTPase n=1 Tax=Terrisporobacter petrolearius TaxID=1460447 RepID=UPI001D16CE7F|nr:hypothetical protein [Terrisporobacter petrolearius]MCC3863157.1 hypothetical protein [Terrisporobacter petrolearius]